MEAGVALKDIAVGFRRVIYRCVPNLLYLLFRNLCVAWRIAWACRDILRPIVLFGPIKSQNATRQFFDFLQNASVIPKATRQLFDYSQNATRDFKVPRLYQSRSLTIKNGSVWLLWNVDELLLVLIEWFLMISPTILKCQHAPENIKKHFWTERALTALLESFSDFFPLMKGLPTQKSPYTASNVVEYHLVTSSPAPDLTTRKVPASGYFACMDIYNQAWHFRQDGFWVSLGWGICFFRSLLTI